jgi:NAD(P)-dependent dehydrogenase (short-subunit alcohol dehydrogenase family)
MSPEALTGQVAVITGAAGGLGRAFALAFAAAGAAVVVADRNEAGATGVAEEIAAQGGAALAVALEVTQAGSAEVMAERAEAWGGRIDILLNNAAIYAGLERKPFWELDEAEWDRVLAVNLKGAWLCAKAIFPAMRRRRYGKIVNVASATVFSGSPLWAHYVASKGALIALTRSMAREAGDYGVTVNALAPGFTLTDASLGLMEDAASYGVNRGAIKRASYPDDMTGAAIFLASPASNFITGQTLIVDGGRQFI